MKPRPFGPSRTQLSPLTFGSMRLDPQRTPKSEAVRLFELLHDRGISTFHSSYEYESFDYFCECSSAFRRNRRRAEIRHIVKLPAPHFDEHAFSAETFVGRIERYRKALDAEHLDVIQWLIRQSPNTYERRTAILTESALEVEDTVAGLRKEGKIGAVASFPYDPNFAVRVLGYPVCDGLATYLNLAELDYAHFVEEASVIAIRPLYAGLLTPSGLSAASADTDNQFLLESLEELAVSRNDVATFAVQFCLMHENVSTVIAGMSSTDHAESLLAAIENIRPDNEAFRGTVDVLSRVRTS